MGSFQTTLVSKNRDLAQIQLVKTLCCSFWRHVLRQGIDPGLRKRFPPHKLLPSTPPFHTCPTTSSIPFTHELPHYKGPLPRCDNYQNPTILVRPSSKYICSMKLLLFWTPKTFQYLYCSLISMCYFYTDSLLIYSDFPIIVYKELEDMSSISSAVHWRYTLSDGPSKKHNRCLFALLLYKDWDSIIISLGLTYCGEPWIAA